MARAIVAEAFIAAMITATFNLSSINGFRLQLSWSFSSKRLTRKRGEFKCLCRSLVKRQSEMIVKNVGPDFMSLGLNIATLAVLGDVS